MAGKIPFFSRVKTQILLSVLLSFILLTGVLSVSLFTLANEIIVGNTTDNAMGIAQSLAQGVDVEAFKNIQSVDDESTEAYQQMRSRLEDARLIAGCSFVYTARRTDDGGYIYVVDGSAIEDISHVGDECEPLDAYEIVLGGTPVQEEELVDQGEWGILASAYYPLVDASGQTVGFLGVDYDAASTYAGLQRFKLIAALIAVAGGAISAVVALVLAQRISRPVQETAAFANALATGELDKTLAVKTKSEVGNLAHILNTNMRDAFIQVQEAHMVAEKQAAYQSAQVQKALVNLGHLAKGELVCNMTVDEGDADTQDIRAIYEEIEANLSSAVRTIRQYIDEMTNILALMAGGDFTVHISQVYLGDFAQLRDSINTISVNINKVLGEVAMAADQVTRGTMQVSQGSQDIARGTTEQASAIQQLTASISEISTQTRQNAANAGQANELAGNVMVSAVSGNEKMREMLAAMEQIRDSSQGIERIIKVIDDIAFQTNILALNAAVEAARAGSHGKGFAVVAEEVRSLAQKSANAAQETTELIQDSVGKAQGGAQIAQETARVLGDIVEGMQAVEGLIGGISVSSGDQALAIDQIDQGVDQVAKVVQVNSAATEQTAATSQQLNSQSELLRSMIARFKLGAQQP